MHDPDRARKNPQSSQGELELQEELILYPWHPI